MARALQPVLQHVSRMAARDRPEQPADAELLRRFVVGRDPAAFELLVWRHGPMVHAVCRRAAGRDADDAFQATFLALVRHARSVRRGESLAGWLHRVARRAAVASPPPDRPTGGARTAGRSQRDRHFPRGPNDPIFAKCSIGRSNGCLPCSATR